MKNKINLLEYVQGIVQLDDERQIYDSLEEGVKKRDTLYAAIDLKTVDLCRAVLAAMEEMERASDGWLKRKSYSPDWSLGLSTAYKNSANILRKHLGAGEEK